MKREKRTIKIGKREEEKEVLFTTKDLKIGSLSDLVDKFDEQIVRYKKHLFTLRSQYNYY